MKRVLLALAAVFVLAAVVVVLLFVLRAPAGPVYPDTGAGWAQRWTDAAAEFGRTPGEHWDLWLEVFAELDTATDPARVAELTDRLRPVERFTPPVSVAVGTLAAWEHGVGTPGGLRRPVLDVILPAMQAAFASGDLDAAADWVDRAWALARVAEGGGTAIGGMVQAGIVTAVLDGLRPHLPAIARADHTRLRALIDDAPVGDVLWSLRMDREIGVGAIHDTLVDSLAMAKDQPRLFEQAMTDWALFEATGDTQARDRVRALVDRLENDTLYARRRVVLDMMLPALPHVGRVFRAGVAERDALRVMLALESWRVANGRYPDSLDALVPGHLDQLPPDPFRPDQPLVYRVTDAGSSDPAAAYLLYTVGVNGVDDGGIDDPAHPGGGMSKPEHAGDFVFNHPRPERPVRRSTPDPDDTAP